MLLRCIRWLFNCISAAGCLTSRPYYFLLYGDKYKWNTDDTDLMSFYDLILAQTVFKSNNQFLKLDK